MSIVIISIDMTIKHAIAPKGKNPREINSSSPKALSVAEKRSEKQKNEKINISSFVLIEITNIIT